MRTRPFDFGLFIIILFLLAFGIIMVASASSVNALYTFHNSYHFLIRQFAWAVLGLAAMLVISKIDYRVWGRFSGLIYLISIALLMLVLIPHVGVNKNGSQRWINLGFGEFQPSEIAKLGIIVFFSYRLSKAKDTLNSFMKGLLPFLFGIGAIVVLLMAQPHLSASIIITGVGIIILFAAGAKVRHFLFLSLPTAVGLFAAIVLEPYRMQRFLTFLNPWSDEKGAGWQIVNSLYAIGSGGIFGLGLGQSRQKFLYIPEPHNDFIFSILAEELGYIGSITVLVLFMIFIWRGMKIAMQSKDTFGSLMATGITSLVALEFIINISVVTSSMPVTGMPLPFFSYGGTSLFFLMVGMGILLNISRSAGNGGSP
jgi:cell division protein FtsW